MQAGMATRAIPALFLGPARATLCTPEELYIDFTYFDEFYLAMMALRVL